jgi:hypothetical protein
MDTIVGLFHRLTIATWFQLNYSPKHYCFIELEISLRPSLFEEKDTE